MDASRSRSLKATADIVFGIHGKTSTDPESSAAPESSFADTKLDDKDSFLIALSKEVKTCKKKNRKGR